MAKTLFKPSKKAFIRNTKPKFLENIKVKNAQGDMVLLSDFWKRKTVVLKVLRRFGCPLCRYEAKLFTELKSEFDHLGVELIAIGFEEVGLDDFISGGYWDWEILIDIDRAMHSILELQKVSVSAGLRDSMSTATRCAVFASHREGISGDLNGDFFQLGGTFVVEKNTGNVLYDHRQTGAGNYPSLKEIFEVCGGDPREVEEKAPVECIVYKNVCTINI